MQPSNLMNTHDTEQRQNRCRQRGFSMIELLVVIVILGVLASVAGVSYLGYVVRADRSEAQAVLVKIADAQEKYYLDNNRYATAGELTPIYVLPNDPNSNWAYAVAPAVGNQQFTATATNATDTDCPAMTITSGNSLGRGSWESDSSCN